MMKTKWVLLSIAAALLTIERTTDGFGWGAEPGEVVD